MALTEKRTLRGGGALELLDLRLFKDGGERGGTLGSDAVFRDTASGGQNGNSERVGMSMGADTKAKGGGALELLDLRLFEDGGERGGALVADVVAHQTVSEEHTAER